MFLFFGVVAVTGSYFVQVQQLPWQAFGCAIPVGLLASAILVVNNVRDLETDRRAGKRTLAVRLGRPRTRTLYAAMLICAFLTAPLPWVRARPTGTCPSYGQPNEVEITPSHRNPSASARSNVRSSPASDSATDRPTFF